MTNYLSLPTARWFMAISATLVAMFISVTPVLADSTALSQRMSADVDKVNELTSYTNDTTDNAGMIISRLNSYHAYFSESSSYYTSLSGGLDPQLQTVSERAKNATAKIATNIITIKNAVSSGDEAGMDRGLDGLNQGIDGLNSAIDSYNSVAATGDDYGPLYIGLSILFGIISLAIFFSNRKPAVTGTEQEKAEAKRNLFRSSLWPTIGAIVTTIWYYATPAGGTYYVLWGPMLIGAFYFLSALGTYFKVRPHLNKTIQQEKLLLSNKNKCDNCGNITQDGVKFCNACGARVNT